jgi:hypothetical protein
MPGFCNKTLYAGLLANATTTYSSNHWEPECCGSGCSNGQNGPVQTDGLFSPVCFVGNDHSCYGWNPSNCSGTLYPDWCVARLIVAACQRAMRVVVLLNAKPGEHMCSMAPCALPPGSKPMSATPT